LYYFNAANETPEPFSLQKQEYQRMSSKYRDRFNQSFPLKQFSEAVYQMWLNDQDSIPIKDFADELELMQEAKMVISRTSREVTDDATPKSRTLWNFRHDKILEYFLVQQFLGKTPEAEFNMQSIPEITMSAIASSNSSAPAAKPIQIK
jgi:hypothetical protein